MLIHGFVAHSRVNGPGMRAVVYFQGCNLGCAGCWNPATHAFVGPPRGVQDVAEQVAAAHQNPLHRGRHLFGWRAHAAGPGSTGIDTAAKARAA